MFKIFSALKWKIINLVNFFNKKNREYRKYKKEISKRLFEKYPYEDLIAMFAQGEAEVILEDWERDIIYDLLVDGCVGYSQMSKSKFMDEFLSLVHNIPDDNHSVEDYIEEIDRLMKIWKESNGEEEYEDDD